MTYTTLQEEHIACSDAVAECQQNVFEVDTLLKRNRIQQTHFEEEFENATQRLKCANLKLKKVNESMTIIALSTQVQTLTTALLSQESKYDELSKQFTELKCRCEEKQPQPVIKTQEGLELYHEKCSNINKNEPVIEMCKIHECLIGLDKGVMDKLVQYKGFRKLEDLHYNNVTQTQLRYIGDMVLIGMINHKHDEWIQNHGCLILLKVIPLDNSYFLLYFDNGINGVNYADSKREALRGVLDVTKKLHDGKGTLTENINELLNYMNTRIASMVLVGI